MGADLGRRLVCVEENARLESASFAGSRRFPSARFRRHLKLVPEWRRAHRWFSVRIAVLIAFASLVQASLPELTTDLPPKAYHWIVFGLAIAVGIGRILQQGSSTDATK